MKNSVMMSIAKTLSQLSTCRRRSVGCVAVDEKYRIIGSGYNGVPSKFEHCTTVPCRLSGEPHGSPCYASHAEQNCLVQCRDPDKIFAMFTTSFPCVDCAKLILNTGCKRVYYCREYQAHADFVAELFDGRIDLIQIGE